MGLTMTRRDALTGAAGALLASWLLPRQVRGGIDLQRFCDTYPHRWDLSRPFRQGGRVYATNGVVMARVAHPGWVELAGEEARLPDAAGVIDWREFDRGGWQSAAKLRRVKRDDAGAVYCPTCRGKGRIGPGVRDCEQCDRDEEIWCALVEPHDCTGYSGGQECDECRGNGVVHYALTLDGDREFGPMYVNDLLSLPGAELRTYVRPKLGRSVCNEFLLCRFSGGEALAASLV